MLAGFISSARAHAERALQFAQESLGDSVSLIQAHNVLAWLHYRQGDHDAAKASVASALDVCVGVFCKVLCSVMTVLTAVLVEYSARRLNSRTSAAGVTMSSLAELSMLLAPSDDDGAKPFLELALRVASEQVGGVANENSAQLVYLAVAVARNSGVVIGTPPSQFLNIAESMYVVLRGSHRSWGVGTFLLTWVVRQARSCDARRVRKRG